MGFRRGGYPLKTGLRRSPSVRDRQLSNWSSPSPTFHKPDLQFSNAVASSALAVPPARAGHLGRASAGVIIGLATQAPRLRQPLNSNVRRRG